MKDNFYMNSIEAVFLLKKNWPKYSFCVLVSSLHTSIYFSWNAVLLYLAKSHLKYFNFWIPHPVSGIHVHISFYSVNSTFQFKFRDHFLIH